MSRCKYCEKEIPDYGLEPIRLSIETFCDDTCFEDYNSFTKELERKNNESRAESRKFKGIKDYISANIESVFNYHNFDTGYFYVEFDTFNKVQLKDNSYVRFNRWIRYGIRSSRSIEEDMVEIDCTKKGFEHNKLFFNYLNKFQDYTKAYISLEQMKEYQIKYLKLLEDETTRGEK